VGSRLQRPDDKNVMTAMKKNSIASGVRAFRFDTLAAAKRFAHRTV